MKKLTFIIVSVLVIIGFSFYACSTDEKSKSQESERGIVTADFQDENSTIKVKSVNYSSPEERSILLEEIYAAFLTEIYVDSEFDSQFQLAGSIVEDNIQEQKLTMKYDVINLNDMSIDELAWAMTGYQVSNAGNDNELYGAKKEKLMHYCDGGTNDGKTITLDRPTNAFNAASYGKKVAQFAADCLDGGGCLQVCNAGYLVLLPNIEAMFELEEEEKIQYQEMLDNTSAILYERLNNFTILSD